MWFSRHRTSMTSTIPRPSPFAAARSRRTVDDLSVQRLAAARDRLSDAESRLHASRRGRLLLPAATAVMGAAGFAVSHVAGGHPNVAVSAGVVTSLVALTWSVLTVVVTMRGTEVRRSATIRDGALMTAAHERSHLHLVEDGRVDAARRSRQKVAS